MDKKKKTCQYPGCSKELIPLNNAQLYCKKCGEIVYWTHVNSHTHDKKETDHD